MCNGKPKKRPRQRTGGNKFVFNIKGKNKKDISPMKKIITLALLLILTFFNYIYADSNKEAYEL
jgi:hypothetical protein